MRRFIPPLTAATLLAIFVLLLFYRLLFTDRVLASGDILHYFYPYRDYAAAALRAGRAPLWNPYIFMGAPFLANPQAAALYPLHWPLSWLPVTRQLYWSGAIHTWILALGGYALMRRWGAGWAAAVSAGLALAGSGFYGGLLGHINQMNGAAWLPWLLWALEGRWRLSEPGLVGFRDGQDAHLPNRNSPTAGGPEGAPPLATGHWKLLLTRYAALLLPFSLFVALTLLAGHTQTTYINLFGVGAWLLVTGARALPGGLRHVIASFLIYALGVLLGVLLAAAQLLPTLELSQLGLRSGGLSYVDVTSFSLRPLLLHWTLLPSYGLRDLSVVFATLGYTEFVAYVGALGLLLALIGLWRDRFSYPWLCGIFFAGLGLFLAVGRWNPFSFIFYHLIPGFDLFRTPARWMMLYTLGMALLAGVGIEWIGNRIAQNRSASRREGRERTPALRLSLSAPRSWPGWLRSLMSIPDASYLLLPLLAFDLLLAARALPHTQPTAPQAVYDVRTASAHLLTEPLRALHPAAMGRLLSMSEITYDPGDMADWRRILRGGARAQLSEAAFTEFVIALKSQEILAPNLSLLWRIPAVDGFDGGVLPLQRYNAFLSLLIPAEELVPDGRVREQLQEIPPAHILELMDVRFVITDKVRDVWFDGIYYDRQIGATLTPDGLRALTVDVPHSFQATAVDIVGFVTPGSDAAQPDAANLPLAEVTGLISGTRRALGHLSSGSEPGAWVALPAPPQMQDPPQQVRPAAQSPAATAIFRDEKNGQQEYLARLPLSEPARLDALEISLTTAAASVGLAVQAVTLIDERTQTFVPLLPSDRGRFRRVHSGDVKIYERAGGSGRAQLMGSVRPAPSLAEALAMLRAPGAEPVVEASAETVAAWGLADAPASSRELTLVSYAPERVVIRTRNEQPAFLVLKDAYYPGWQAAVNGAPAEIYPTNALFRGVPLPAGENEVVFSYRPGAWQTGLRISLAGALLWLLLALWTLGAARTTNR